jgi:outer membrane protein OmpA-like peptidoglycan-associated protein
MRTINIFKKMPVVFAMIMAMFTSSVFTACSSWNKTAKGGAIGAGVGGAIGGVIGHQTGNTAMGAIIGAAVGGATGAAIGHYMDKQAEELQRDLKGAKVERVGEGIHIVFDSGILFDSGSNKLKPEAQKNIDDLARVLKKYDDTNIMIEGHTDDKGAEEYNQQLSEKRAQAVAHYAAGLGVDNRRFSVTGFGESHPVAVNSTEQGRRQNRRVEIAIVANEKLKKAAEKGEI